MSRCSACGGENPDHARFCLLCGAAITSACRECGTPLPAGANFCPSCGASVKEPDLPSTEMIKLVTVLFGDVVGSTAQAERMDPEDTRELMAEFFEAMSEEIRKQGGTVERLIGDAIMADFGVPLSREDDAVRAVRAALGMLRQLEEFNAARPPELGVRLRIGVNTGEVSTGGSLGEQLLVMGDAVNVAARLEQAAEPGTVVIGERTARAVGHRFELTPLDALSVKGKSTALKAFRVEGEFEAGHERRATAPFVGRVEELQQLTDVFEAARREGRPHTVSLIGEAGVGKSRLKREFLDSVEDRANILRGRCLPYGEGVTLWPLREILTRVAALDSADPPDVVLTKIESVTKTIQDRTGVRSTPMVVAALASTVGLETSDAVGELDPRELYQELVRAWRALISNLAADRPLVIVIEDFHWADKMLLDVLEDLAHSTIGALLYLFPTRPDFLRTHPEWVAAISNYTAISLGPLSYEHSARLMLELATSTNFPDDLSRRILAKAEGNPFFLEEIFHRLVDDGSLVLADGGVEIARDVSEIELPDTIQGAILSRLDLLTAFERSVTQHAAVVGRTFWTGSVRELVGVPDIEPALRGLKQRQMVAEEPISSIGDDVEHTFKHILIRDVAYQTLPRKARGLAHAKTARWIERVRGVRADEASELLAHHYEQAYRCLGEEELRGHARDHSRRAARAAVRKFAIQQAETFGRKVVELSRSREERVEALQALGDLYTLTFKSDGAWNAYVEAVAEHDQDSGSDSGIAQLAAKAAIVPTRWRGTMRALPEKEEIRGLIDRGLAAAGPADLKERSLLLSSKAFYLGLYRDPESVEGPAAGETLAREAAELAEKVDDVNLVSVAMDAEVCCLMPTGSWNHIDEVNRRRVALIPTLRDAREACDANAMVALSSIRIGSYEDAAHFATRCVDRAAGVDAGSYLQGLVWRICALFMLGRWDEALSDHAEVERLQAESTNAPGAMAMRAYASVLLCRELRGDAGFVADRLDTVRAFIEQRRAAGTAAGGVEPDVARTLAHRNELDDAVELLSTEPGAYQSVHLEAMCDVLSRTKAADAASVLALARSEQARAGLAALGGFADRLEGTLAAAAGDPNDAASHLGRSALTFARLRAPWEEAWSRTLLGEVLSEAKPREAERELSLALGIFQRLGSVAETERAGELIGTLGP